MYETNNMIPVGTSLLGRVINGKGEAVDGKGSIAGTTLLSLVKLAPGTDKRPGANKVCETGIKVIDLLAPMAYGGVSEIFADAGVGQQVIVEEIMQHVTTHSSKSVLICLSMDESSYETSELMGIIHEGGLESRMVMVFEQATTPEAAQRIAQAGLTIARHFQDQGYTTLMVIDKQVTTHGELIDLDAFRTLAAQQAITTILLGTGDDYTRYQQNGALDKKLDAHLVCNRELFKRQIYPAIDPLRSGSRLLDEGLVSPAHAQVAQQTRQLLQRYYELRERVATNGESGLSAEDQRTFRRGQRVEQFLTQPFAVAEPYTDIPGEDVRLDDTVRSFEALLSGQHDDVPERSFWMVGTIEQALAKH